MGNELDDILDAEIDLELNAILAYAKSDYENGLSVEEIKLKYDLEDLDVSDWEIKNKDLELAMLDGGVTRPNIVDKESEEYIISDMLKHRKTAIGMVGTMLGKMDKMLSQDNMTIVELSMLAGTHAVLLKAVTPETPKGAGVVVNNIGSLTNYAQTMLANSDRDC